MGFSPAIAARRRCHEAFFGDRRIDDALRPNSAQFAADFVGALVLRASSPMIIRGRRGSSLAGARNARAAILIICVTRGFRICLSAARLPPASGGAVRRSAGLLRGDLVAPLRRFVAHSPLAGEEPTSFAPPHPRLAAPRSGFHFHALRAFSTTARHRAFIDGSTPCALSVSMPRLAVRSVARL